MGSNYSGVDSFSASLTLMTDDDAPQAAVFRVPAERMLDNDVHLEARATALERGLASERGRYVEVFDDFLQILDNSGATVPHVLSDSGVWRFRVSSDAADVTVSGGLGANLHAINLVRAANSPQAGLAKESASGTLTAWRMHARVTVLATTAGAAAEIGFVSAASPTPGNASGGAVTAYYDQATSANWLLRTRDATSGLESVADTGVAVTTSRVRLEIAHNGTTWTLAIDGGDPTPAGDNIPGVSATAFPCFRFAATAASQGISVELFHARNLTQRW